MPSRSQSRSTSESTPLLRELSPTPLPSQSTLDVIRERDEVICEGDGTEADDGDDGKGLEGKQIFFLCLARTVEPIAFFGIFPFINQMIFEMGVRKEDVGFWSGLVESLFSLTQMCLMIFWGRAADRIGRKPVLVFSLLGVSCATAVFGLSKKLWMLVLVRCCAGVFAGSIVTIRTMITENSTHKTQARAFSYFMFAGNVGIFIGPLIGGALANPTTQYPIDKIFHGSKLFKHYPYALPTLTTGAISLFATVCTFSFVKETLKKKDKSGLIVQTPPMSAWKVTKAPGVPLVLFVYANVMLLAYAYTAVSPVFYFTSIELGGWEFSPAMISIFFAVIGVSQALWQLVVFPPLQKKFGTVKVLKACMIGWPLLLGITPFTNWLLRMGWTRAFWTMAPPLEIIGSGVCMSFTCIQLLLNAAVPDSPDLTSIGSKTANLGTLNAIALTLSSGTRAFAPASFNSLFAISIGSQLLSGYLAWFIMASIALVGTVVVFWKVEDIEGEGSKRHKSHDYARRD